MWCFLFNPAFTLLTFGWLALIMPSLPINKNISVILEKGSTLRIHGRTNINTFSCRYEGEIGQDTLNVRVREQSDSLLQLEQARLSVAVSCFDCGNPIMNKDFRKLLEHEQYPRLQLDILSLRMTDSADQNCQLRATVRFTVAGEENTYEVPVQIANEAGSSPAYQGEQCLDITDFNLTPPKKFLGTVVVDEEVTIEFDLNLRVL